METREFVVWGLKDLYFFGAYICLLVDKAVSVLLYGLDRCGFGLQEYDTIGFIYQKQDRHPAHSYKFEEKHVPGVQ